MRELDDQSIRERLVGDRSRWGVHEGLICYAKELLDSLVMRKTSAWK